MLENFKKSFGIRGMSHSGLEAISATANNSQRLIKVSLSLSSVNIGVPQGSILGPISFPLHISDLTRCSDEPDTNVFIQGADVAESEAVSNVELACVAACTT